MGLYAKLLEVQKCVRALLPNAEGCNYRYVSGSKVLSVIRPKMDELGLLLKQEVVSITNTRQDYSVGRDQRPKSEILSCVMMRFTWIDAETGEKEVCDWGANGQNDWDKGVGSAMTYAERYFLLKFFHLATDEDDVDNPDRNTRAKSPAVAPKPSLTAAMLVPDLFEQIISAKQTAKAAGKRFSTLGYLESTYSVDAGLIDQVNRQVTDYYNLTRNN